MVVSMLDEDFDEYVKEQRKEAQNELLEELANDMLELKRSKCYSLAFDIIAKKQDKLSKK